MKKLLLIAAICCFAFTAKAYDFSAVYEGKTLYYKILSETRVEVCSESNLATPYISGVVVIPANVTHGSNTYTVVSVGANAFGYCSGLTSITMPNSVKSIGNLAFYKCSGLTSCTLSNALTFIGNGAFMECSVLSAIAIPNSVTFLGESAFSDCTGLTSAVLSNALTNIETTLFFRCSSLVSITIPNSVVTIGERSFSDCSGLTSLSLSNSLTTIEDEAFFGCSGLTSITIPNSITTLGLYCFRNCSGLTSIFLPNSITSFGVRSFAIDNQLTSHLEEITVAWETPFQLLPSMAVFGGHTPSNITLKVPIGSGALYQTAMIWKDFNIEETNVLVFPISSKTAEVILCPNPVKDMLHIQTAQTIEKIAIYDLNGRLLQQIPHYNGAISVADLSTGLYFVRVTTPEGATTLKFTKN
ncbi:MAG: leucine-rich repeat protein [Bacteroidales bacterium]|jgi:hypothetical protein|nr:leucine-rich repeat protein [Bacteroidales bacterium]